MEIPMLVDNINEVSGKRALLASSASLSLNEDDWLVDDVFIFFGDSSR